MPGLNPTPTGTRRRPRQAASGGGLEQPYETMVNTRDPLPHRIDDDDSEDTGPQGTSLLFDRHLLDARTLLLAGPVTDKMAKECATRLLVMEAQDAKAPVTVFINSPGGSADSGFAIYDMLRFVSPPIRTIVNGLCASAGILIHLAGDKGSRFALPESRFMIHQPSTAGQGTASDLDITAKEVLKLRERYNRIISEAAGVDPEKVVADAQRDFWLNSAEALEYGLIDRIVTERADLA
jgi:ATP-dependent Clp protease protease subunit